MIAPKGMNAQYASISSTFGNAAMMIGAQITNVFAYSRIAAFLVLGGVALLNAVIMLVVGVMEYNKDHAATQNQKSKSALEEFFGEVCGALQFL